MKPAWRVQLSQGAERDFFSILRWTTEHFGKQQARVYETTLRHGKPCRAQGRWLKNVVMQDLTRGP